MRFREDRDSIKEFREFAYWFGKKGNCVGNSWIADTTSPILINTCDTYLNRSCNVLYFQNKYIFIILILIALILNFENTQNLFYFFPQLF